jgi:hypothetical protein
MCVVSHVGVTNLRVRGPRQGTDSHGVRRKRGGESARSEVKYEDLATLNR